MSERDPFDERMEQLEKELAECRDHLSNLLGLTPTTEQQKIDLKAAADWLANWDGERL